jgi:hypothetical protein
MVLQAAIYLKFALAPYSETVARTSFAIAYATANVAYDPYYPASPLGSVVNLAQSAYIVYVRNVGSSTVAVTYTTNLAATPITTVLEPGGVFLYSNSFNTAGGINSLLLTGNGPCELLVGN